MENNEAKSKLVEDNQDSLEKKTGLKAKRNLRKAKKHNKRQIKSRTKAEIRQQKVQLSFFKKLKSWWPFSKVSGRIIFGYLLAILIGGFLLSIPGVVVASGQEWDMITGMFTASSAISDTGITTLDTHVDYSIWGQVFILIMIKIGGVGLLTLKIVLLSMLNKKVSVDDQNVAGTERGAGTLGNTVEMIKDAFIFLTAVEIFGMFVLFFGFYFTPMSTTEFVVNNPYHDFAKSGWAAIFHSISAVNNAGFDILSNASLQPYNQPGQESYFIQVIFMFQWIIGGLGYPTYTDIKRKIKAHKEGKEYRFSLFTKINFLIYSILLVLGPILVVISEVATYEKSLIIYNGVEKRSTFAWVFDIIFNVTSCRNAGFSTVSVNNFTAGSKLIMAFWMFIGSAPSSTAGGIRTTTFGICVFAIFAVMRNKQSVESFHKKIPEKTVRRSFVVVFISIFVVVSSIFVVYIDSNKMLWDLDPTIAGTNYTIIELIVYVCSAFGTVGFQPFDNSEILAMGVISKIILVLTMFIGQLGISNTLLAFVKPKTKHNFGYLEEDVTIG
ncbi:potassium uptake protein KtrB [Spiroplasma clarkii]|uniref:Potassium uptake protein KtrB n=1 Tax=Spiroplasma clarkii TaxID=2139 RepID=A0A1Y0L3D0_9MOLU|nr:potassium transporter TrkG [Spiroplasma clarkii]ARU92225.1 potassium uptake protein KtrB [Spiroplasma clarkii]ATX71547.1 potassium uptake protein KtrB [Spiroplasma clarkii]